MKWAAEREREARGSPHRFSRPLCSSAPSVTLCGIRFLDSFREDGTAGEGSNSSGCGVSIGGMPKKHVGLALSLAVVAVAVVALGFAGRTRVRERAKFPEVPVVTRLPIRGPLVRPDLTVMVTLQASEKRAEPVWMTVDSGATGVTMPEGTYAMLGLDIVRGLTIRTEDPSGRVLHREAGLVPTVKLGALQVEEVITALGGEANVLGQSLLAHAPWEIDWDRGMLTMGTTPWSADAETVVVPLRSEADGEVVTLNVDGAPVDMILDTGAFTSTLPITVGKRAGLPGRNIPPTVLRATAGEVVVRHLYEGKARLGPLEVGSVTLAGVQSGGKRANLGLLGLDVLSRFQMQVVPGSRLALRPRGDVRKTLKERIARWSFIPSTCAHVGCVKAELSPHGDDARITVTLEADLGQPVEVLFGCEGAADDTHVPTGSSFAFADVPAVARHVRVHVPAKRRGEQTVIRSGAAWFDQGGCRALEALDVSPTRASVTAISIQNEPSRDLEAMFWP